MAQSNGNVPSNGTTASPYSWKELNPGHWSRKLFGMEPYFVFFGNLTSSMVNGREHFIIATSVKLKNSLDIEKLKKTWTQLRFEQPGLATYTDASDWSLHYKVPNEAEVAHWIEETVVVVPDTSYDQLFPDFQPISTSALYWLPDSQELIIRLPHWQIDGVGSMLLWDAFFSAYEKTIKEDYQAVSFGQEVKNLAPTIREIWKVSEDEAAAHQAQGQTLMGNWLGNVPGVGPAPMETTPGKCQKIEVEYDQSTSISLITAIKKKGISVTAAFHAAFILANAREVPNGSEKNNYASMANVSLRKYLGNTSSDRALNVWYTPMPLALPVESFDKLGAALNKFYLQKYNSPEQHATLVAFLDFLFQVAQSSEFLAAPVPGDAMVSSLGIGENYLKKSYANDAVRIDDLHTGQDVVLGMSIVFLYSFGGKLRFTYCYNDGLQDVAVVERIVNSTKAIFEQELGL